MLLLSPSNNYATKIGNEYTFKRILIVSSVLTICLLILPYLGDELKIVFMPL